MNQDEEIRRSKNIVARRMNYMEPVSGNIQERLRLLIKRTGDGWLGTTELCLLITIPEYKLRMLMKNGLKNVVINKRYYFKLSDVLSFLVSQGIIGFNVK